jgi:hypothetical protein
MNSRHKSRQERKQKKEEAEEMMERRGNHFSEALEGPELGRREGFEQKPASIKKQ